jgi:hypothetical protein
VLGKVNVAALHGDPEVSGRPQSRAFVVPSRHHECSVRRSVWCLDLAVTLIAIPVGIIVAVLGDTFGLWMAGFGAVYLLTFLPLRRWLGRDE